MAQQSGEREPAGVGWKALALAALLTCAVAVYNGFPLTYPDTGSYVDNAIDLLRVKKPWIFFRPLTYGALLVPFANRLTIWLLPLVQGALVAAAVALALTMARVRLSSRAFVAVFAGLSLLTSLSWFSGQIMPDVFTPIVILLASAVVWTPDPVGSPRFWGITVLLALGIASHLSHFPLYAMLLPAAIVGRLALDPAARSWRRAAMLAMRGAAPLLAAGLIVIAPNYVLYRKAVLSRGSPLFALGHLVGDGSVQRYLERACPQHPYALCSDLATLRPDVDWFMWDPNGPRARSAAAMAHGDSTLLREAPLIVAGTLRQEWPAVIRHSFRDTAVQLVTFGVHPGEQAYSAAVEASMRRLGPSVEAAYAESRQARGAIPAATVSRIHYWVVCAGLLGLLLSLPALRDPVHRPLWGLAVTAAIGVVANAAILASLSTVHPRYQSRVIWLVPLLGTVAALRWLERGRADRRGDEA
ncbi:MAG TPA: hypothetical protein VHR41_05685 [Gemmatimonadales bacterium]|jgi:hypothetical protein|nr:hypothetical protein [Gemmatimonadales bacterium]